MSETHFSLQGEKATAFLERLDCVPYVLMSAFHVEMGVDIRPLRNFR